MLTKLRIRQKLSGGMSAMLGGFVFRAASVALGFLVTIYIGRTFGPVGSGYYAVLTQTGMLLSIIVLGGFDFAVVKEYSGAHAHGRKVATWSLTGLLLLILITSAVTSAAFIVLPASWSERLLSFLPGVKEYVIVCVILLMRSATRLTGAFLRSQGDHKVGQMVEVILIPLLVLLPITVMQYRSVDQVLYATLVSGLVAAVIGVSRSFTFTSSHPSAFKVPMARLARVGLPMWGLGISLSLADWYTVAVVSNMSGLHAAGVLRVAMQIGTTLLFGVSGVMAIFSAQVAKAHHQRDLTAVGSLLRKAVLLNCAVAVAPAVAIYPLAPFILQLVGGEFVGGADVLRIILVGQIAYAILAPSGVALAMVGYGHVNLGIVVVSTVAFLILAPLLAAGHGIEGVGVAMVAFICGRNLASFLFFRVLTGVNGITGRVISRGVQN